MGQTDKETQSYTEHGMGEKEARTHTHTHARAEVREKQSCTETKALPSERERSRLISGPKEKMLTRLTVAVVFFIRLVDLDLCWLITMPHESLGAPPIIS